MFLKHQGRHHLSRTNTQNSKNKQRYITLSQQTVNQPDVTYCFIIGMHSYVFKELDRYHSLLYRELASLNSLLFNND